MNLKLPIATLFFLSSFSIAKAQEPKDTTLRPVLDLSKIVSMPTPSMVVTKTIEVPPIPPVANFSQLLQGRVAGMFATSTNGRPGSPAAIFIRGRNTIDGNSGPYYLINGVPTTVGQLSTINPADIESVTVLKDASATALYGINGGNGVVLVKTKQGTRGPLKIQLSAEAGVSTILKNRFDLMDTRQKLDYELGLGLIDQSTYNARLPYSYNQVDEIFQPGWLQNYNLQLSGGDDRTTYSLSGGYYNQDGILDKSNFNRFSLSANIDAKMAKWLKMGFGMYAGREKNTYPLTQETGIVAANSYANLPFAALRLNPYEGMKNADGSYKTSLATYPVNPLLEASNFNDKAGTTNLNGTGFLDISFCPKLTLRSSIVLGSIGSEVNGDYFQDMDIAIAYQFWDSNVSRTTIIQTNKLSYSTFIDTDDTHHLTLSLSEETQSTKGEENKVEGQSSLSGSDPNLSRTTLITRSKILSGMLQASYDYKKRLFLDATYRIDRVDMSQAPEADNATAWSIGTKWVILDRASSLSLKVGMGEVGKLLFQEPVYSDGFDNTFLEPIFFLHNQRPLWETTKSYNFGVDANLFNNRLSITAEYYHKRTANAFTAFSYYPDNGSKIQNRGIELTADWRIISHWKYFLTISGNLSLNENKILNLADNNFRIRGVTALKEGEPVGNYYLSEWGGVDPGTGKPTWLDAQGQPTTNFYAAQKFIEGKSNIPSKFAGITLSGGYKGFSLSAQLYGIWDIYTYNSNLFYLETSSNYGQKNTTARMANYWKKPGDITDIPNTSASFDNLTDTRWLQNHSYIRLKNITLSYDFSSRVLRPLGVVRALRLYATVQNLFTVTGYKGYTPEVLGSSDNASYPEALTVSCGIKLTF